jgi:hypothetical protein
MHNVPSSNQPRRKMREKRQIGLYEGIHEMNYTPSGYLDRHRLIL